MVGIVITTTCSNTTAAAVVLLLLFSFISIMSSIGQPRTDMSDGEDDVPDGEETGLKVPYEFDCTY